MSVTGYWIIAAVPQAAVEPLLACSEPPAEPEDLSWWRIMDGAALTEPETRGLGHGPAGAVLRFIDMTDARQPDLNADEWIDLLDDLMDTDRFAAGIRKGNPVAALYYGLGFEASRALPGRSGCFLLTAEEVATVTPVVEAVLTMDPRRHAEVVDRMRAWVQVAADADHDDVEELITGPLRVLRRAREQGLGAFGIVQWY